MAPADPPGERQSWLDRRRDRIVAEIRRNRRGGHKVPTWVLATALVAIIAAWCGLVIALS